MIKNNVEQLIFKTRGEAEDVLDKLNDLIVDYGEASVADYYTLCGVISDYSDNKHGWLNLKDATVWRGLGGYVILLPQVVGLAPESEPNNMMAGADYDGDKPLYIPVPKPIREIVIRVLNENITAGPFAFMVPNVGKQVKFNDYLVTVESINMDKDEYVIVLR